LPLRASSSTGGVAIIICLGREQGTKRKAGISVPTFFINQIQVLYISELLTETYFFYLNLIILYPMGVDYGETLTLPRIPVFNLTRHGA